MIRMPEELKAKLEGLEEGLEEAILALREYAEKDLGENDTELEGATRGPTMTKLEEASEALTFLDKKIASSGMREDYKKKTRIRTRYQIWHL